MAEISITDIWFHTPMSLSDIAGRLELSEVEGDAENHWAWVIGTFCGARIDVARARGLAGKVEVRVFRLDMLPFEDALKSKLIESLKSFVRGTIRCGQWLHRNGEEFEMRETESYN